MTSLPAFTRRQQQVFDLMRQGMPTRLIAEVLGVTVHAVKHHRTFILKRMGVANTAALIYALQQAQRPAPMPPASDGGVLPKVLVVEDDETTQSLVVSGMQLAGFEARGVASGAAMWSSLSESGAQITVLDLNLGEDDGLDLARELRETQPRMGIVMMTERGMVTDRIEGYLTGADAYLVKPVDIRELVGVIRNLYQRLFGGPPTFA